MSVEWKMQWVDVSDGSSISYVHGEERATVQLASALSPDELRAWAKKLEEVAEEIEQHYSTQEAASES